MHDQPPHLPRFPVHSGIHACAGPGGSVPFSDRLRTFFLFLAQRRLRLVSSVSGEGTASYTSTGVSGLLSVCQYEVLICVCFCVFLFISLQVLFRLNFLVLVLCVVMDRPYQFYYFVPLVTFWFVVIYGTLAVWPQILQKKANSRCQRAFNFICFTHLQTTQKQKNATESWSVETHCLFYAINVTAVIDTSRRF